MGRRFMEWMAATTADRPPPVPSLGVIDAALAGFDFSVLGRRGAAGESLENTEIVIVHRGHMQDYGDRCGIWTVSQRLVGHVGRSKRTGAIVGQLTDPAGRILGEREELTGRDARRALGWPPDRWGNALRGFVWRVTVEDRLLATLALMPTGFTITTTPDAKPWKLTAGRDTCTVRDGDSVLAAGQAKTFSKWGYWTGDRRLTTALSLHRNLDLDQRIVVLMAVLGLLGPPNSDPSD